MLVCQSQIVYSDSSFDDVHRRTEVVRVGYYYLCELLLLLLLLLPGNESAHGRAHCRLSIQLLLLLYLLMLLMLLITANLVGEFKLFRRGGRRLLQRCILRLGGILRNVYVARGASTHVESLSRRRGGRLLLQRKTGAVSLPGGGRRISELTSIFYSLG